MAFSFIFSLHRVKLVSPRIIRREFNACQFWQRTMDGQLITRLARPERHADPLRTEEPLCTMSQTVEYFTLDGQRVARVHQYLRLDGTIGGKGRPDPKWLRVGGWVLGMRSTKAVSPTYRSICVLEDIYVGFLLRLSRWLRSITKGSWTD